MPARLKYPLLSLLLTGTLSWQAICQVITSATPHSLKTADHAIIQASPTLLPPTNTPTIVPSPTQAPSQTPAQLNSQSLLNLRLFLTLWQAVNDNYLYLDLNGLDWDDEMIALLNDDPSFFLSPKAAEEDAGLAGQNNYVGVGILTYPVPERNRIVVVLTFPGNPAEQAGIKPHDSVLEADGVPIFDEDGILRNLLRGLAGIEVVLTAQSPGEKPRQIRVNGAGIYHRGKH